MEFDVRDAGGCHQMKLADVAKFPSPVSFSMLEYYYDMPTPA